MPVLRRLQARAMQRTSKLAIFRRVGDARCSGEAVKCCEYGASRQTNHNI
jgi:hypothetical protein